MSLIEEYLEYQKLYEKKFGENTIVTIQVGKFYEVYEIDINDIKIGKAREISNKLGMVLTKRNKKEIHSTSNPYLIGFPVQSLDNYKRMIIRNLNCTLVIVSQQKGNSSERYVSEICNEFNNLDDNFILEQYIFSLYIENRNVGISYVDLITGKSYVDELYNNNLFENVNVKDEIYRLILSTFPKILLIYFLNYQDNEEDFVEKIIKHLPLNCHFQIVKKEILNYQIQPNYLNNILQHFFTTTLSMSLLESLNLERHRLGSISYVLLLEYIKEFTGISNIISPIITNLTKHLILSYNAIEQLDVIRSDKNKSLLNILDKTYTTQGKRFLKHNILNPITEINELNTRYDIIDYFLGFQLGNDTAQQEKTNIFYEIIEIFKSISIDVEKFYSKMLCINIKYFQFSSMIDVFKKFVLLIDKVKHLGPPVTKILPNEIYINTLFDFLNEVSNVFKFEDEKKDEEIKKIIPIYSNHYLSLNSLTEYSLLIQDVNNGPEVVKHLFNQQTKAREIANSIIKLFNDLEKVIPIIELKYTPTDKLYFSVPKTYQTKIPKKYKVNKKFKKLKIYHNELSELTDNLLETCKDINKRFKEFFKEKIINYSKKYNEVFKIIIHFSAKLDFLLSASCIAHVNNYCRPFITNLPCSFFEAKELRHPIVEQILEEVKYVPNDVLLDKGILLYSPNSCGKSVFSKSIALAVLMAQAGFFVPASYFNFTIFENIITRLTGNDDIYKGKSSFVVEMYEVNNILRNSGNSTLVIGDEICRGTETPSAIGIITATILKLVETQTRFIFSSHIHELVSIDEIKDLIKSDNISILHFTVTYDTITDCLVYDRKIKVGSGDAIYGIEIAQSFNLGFSFINKAKEVRRRYLNDYFKVSKYNKNLIVDKCQLCGEKENLHTHHIIPQSSTLLSSSVKNKKYNLVVLCTSCHHNVHSSNNRKIDIKGYKETTKGKKLIIVNNDNTNPN
jgi:DNA mismatch repair protein MutS